MGDSTFKNYLKAIQDIIDDQNETAASLETIINTLTIRVQNGVGLPETQIKLNERLMVHAVTRNKIEKLEKFLDDLKKNWSKPEDRIIGFVRWAPPFGTGVAPHSYIRDLCVIELYKNKFKHMVGNVLSLGAVQSIFIECR